MIRMILARIDSEHVNRCVTLQDEAARKLELKDEAASKLVFVPLKKG